MAKRVIKRRTGELLYVGERQKFTGNCNCCGKKGHKEAQCFAKKRGEPKKVQNQGNSPPSMNHTESTNTVEDMFAGMSYCVEIKEKVTYVQVSTRNG